MTRPLFVDSRRDLLASLIDYAGLYPPASLELGDAIAEYRRARSDDHNWMLGTFIIDASLLEELAAVLVTTMYSGEAPWDISVILGGSPGTAASGAQAFNAEMNPAARIVMVEARLPREVAEAGDSSEAAAAASQMFSAAASVSSAAMPFLEIPTGVQTHQVAVAVAAVAHLRNVGHRRAGAKLRCGGLTPEAFPDPSLVAAFLVACRDRGLPYKATAGLHHPIRHLDPELGVTRHGFLNLLVAAAMAELGADTATVEDIVAEEDASAFGIGSAGMTWRNHHATGPIVSRMRSERLASYGSCSFAEPVADLVNLGLLAPTPV